MELDKNNEQLQKDFSAGQPFFNVTEMRNGKYSNGNLKLSKLDLNEINEKLNKVFKKLKSAAKLNLALEFIEMWTKININFFTLMTTTRSLKNFEGYSDRMSTRSHFKTELKWWIRKRRVLKRRKTQNGPLS